MPRPMPPIGSGYRSVWLSDEDEDVEPYDVDDYTPSEQLSDMVDDVGDDSITEEEMEDMYDPTDLEDYG